MKTRSQKTGPPAKKPKLSAKSLKTLIVTAAKKGHTAELTELLAKKTPKIEFSWNEDKLSIMFECLLVPADNRQSSSRRKGRIDCLKLILDDDRFPLPFRLLKDIMENELVDEFVEGFQLLFDCDRLAWNVEFQLNQSMIVNSAIRNGHVQMVRFIIRQPWYNINQMVPFFDDCLPRPLHVALHFMEFYYMHDSALPIPINREMVPLLLAHPDIDVNVRSDGIYQFTSATPLTMANQSYDKSIMDTTVESTVLHMRALLRVESIDVHTLDVISRHD